MAASLAFTLSEAVLQAATTQCDLLMASYCVIAVYLMSETLKKNENSYSNFIFLGIAGGAAVLSKVSAGIVLLPFLIGFVPLYILKNKNIKAVIHIFMAGISAVVVPLSYWIRTGIDLNGDFLASKMSSGMSMISGGVINTIAGRVIANIGYLFGGHNIVWSNSIDKAVCGLYKILGASEIDANNFSVFTQYVSHDEERYVVQMLLVIIAVMVILFMAWKTKKAGVLAYTVLGGISLVMIGASISAGIPSIARYALGPVMLLIPLVGVAGEYLENSVKFSEISKGIYYTGLIMAFGTALLVNVADCRQSPTFRVSGQGYESFRNRSYFGQGYDIAAQEYLEIIEKEKMTQIGFMEKEVSGYYPALYKFKDKKYTTKSIYGTSGLNHLDKNFIPDCIVYVGRDINNTIEYSGKIYELKTEARPLLFNGAKTALYLLKS